MKKFALCVGVEQYRDQRIAPLRYARADAHALADRLRDRCGFNRVVVLADERGNTVPDLVNILNALQDLAGEIREEDLFLLFFSGHGIEVDGRGYLLTQDSPQAFPEHCSLALELLRKTLARFEARRRILFIDACRNTPQAGKGDAGNFMSEAISKDIVTTIRHRVSQPTTTAMLCACRPGQRAYEWPGRQHGVFTHFLLEGLDGAAWDHHRLDLRDLARYTMQSVRGWCQRTPGINEIQEPWYEEAGDAEGIVLSSVAAVEAPPPQPAIAPAPQRQPSPVAPALPPIILPQLPSTGRTAPQPTSQAPPATAVPLPRAGAQTAPQGQAPRQTSPAPPLIRIPVSREALEERRRERHPRMFRFVLALTILALLSLLLQPPRYGAHLFPPIKVFPVCVLALIFLAGWARVFHVLCRALGLVYGALVVIFRALRGRK